MNVPERAAGGDRRRTLRTSLLLLALFLAAWVPRAVALDKFVTIDERKWLARSANFYQAMSQEDWADTFQREHPGVTVMWAGTLGFLTRYPEYAQDAPGQFAWDREYIEAWLREEAGVDPLDLLAAGRWWVVLGVALAVTASYYPLRRLFGETIAFFGTLYVAWTPFYVALSRQLHPDGLSSSLIFLALLLFLGWLYAGRAARYLVASGLIMGLAWLTKTPAIFLVPTGAVLIALAWWQDRGDRERNQISHRNLVSGFILWGVIATATFVILWPAMWVDPLGTLARMAAEMTTYVERHTNVNYFMGQPVANPGPFFYPVAWLFRSSPLTWLGLVFAGLLAGKRRSPFDATIVRRAAGGLLIFALIFTLGMTVGAKKFDRYILPVFLALDVIAVLGWAGVAGWLRARWPQKSWTRRTSLAAWILAGATLLHGLLTFVHYPYYFTYYNPLLGDGRTAPKVLFVGWGEGLDQAAAWLNQQPDAEDLRVAAWYHDGPFSYFFDGAAVGVSSDSPLFWLDTDYAVLYVNQWQRQIPSPEAIDYFFAREPVHVVRSGGVELARIYDMRDVTLPDFVDIGKESGADFGGQIRLAAYDFDTLQAEPGDVIDATFYLQSLVPMETDYNVLVELTGPDGETLWREEGWPWGAPTSDWPVREIRPDGHQIAIPEDAVPGLYRLSLAVYDPATLERLPVTAIDSDELISDSSRGVALIRVGDAPANKAPLDPAWRFDRFFALTGAAMPARAAAGDALPLSLLWESREATGVDYTVFVHVVDADGQQVAGLDRPPMNGFAATHMWRPGQRIEDEMAIPLPDDLAPGRYEVQVGLYTLDGGRLPVLRDGGDQVVGDSVVVGAIEVR